MHCFRFWKQWRFYVGAGASVFGFASSSFAKMQQKSCHYMNIITLLCRSIRNAWESEICLCCNTV